MKSHMTHIYIFPCVVAKNGLGVVCCNGRNGLYVWLTMTVLRMRNWLVWQCWKVGMDCLCDSAVLQKKNWLAVTVQRRNWLFVWQCKWGIYCVCSLDCQRFEWVYCVLIGSTLIGHIFVNAETAAMLKWVFCLEIIYINPYSSFLSQVLNEGGSFRKITSKLSESYWYFFFKREKCEKLKCAKNAKNEVSQNFYILEPSSTWNECPLCWEPQKIAQNGGNKQQIYPLQIGYSDNEVHGISVSDAQGIISANTEIDTNNLLSQRGSVWFAVLITPILLWGLPIMCESILIISTPGLFDWERFCGLKMQIIPNTVPRVCLHYLMGKNVRFDSQDLKYA